MGFRDELRAARARTDALEQRVAELEAEKAALQRGEERPDEPELRRVPVGLAVIMFGSALLFGGGGALALVFGPKVLGVLALVAASLITVGSFVLSSLIEIVPPGFLLVLSGRRYLGPDGRESGFRVVTGPGRVVRVPILEQADWLDARPRPIEASVSGAYSKGGEPLEIDLTAVIRIARGEPRVHDAIERFLGRELAEVDRVARETLEGQLRGLVAERTPEEVRQDAERFASELIECAEDDFARLGLELESLHLERVAGRPT